MSARSQRKDTFMEERPLLSTTLDRRRLAPLIGRKATPGTVAAGNTLAYSHRMATRAEEFRAAAQRKRPKPPRAETKPSPTKKKPSAVARRATFKLETVAGSARPSRKSTRKAANRAKPDTNLERRRIRKAHSPEERARKETARRS
jgi:hypothetical protein